VRPPPEALTDPERPQLAPLTLGPFLLTRALAHAPAPTGPHISPEIRAAFSEQSPEIAKHVREVAATK
jgi:hypothetical protein